MVGPMTYVIEKQANKDYNYKLSHLKDLEDPSTFYGKQLVVLL